MKIKIERNILMNVLEHTHNIVQRREIMDLLTNILLEVDDNNSLKITGTDTAIYFSETVPLLSGSAGSITIRETVLYDIVKQLNKDSYIEMELNKDENILTLNSGKSSEFKLNVLSSENFPTFDESSDDFNVFNIDPKKICYLIDKTLFSVSTEEARFYLNGIFIHTLTENGATYLSSATTDGHRLSTAKTVVSNDINNKKGVIIPTKAAREIRKLLQNIEESVEVTITTTSIKFKYNEIVFVSRLIENQFPKYQEIIPKIELSKKIVVSTDKLMSALNLVSTISIDRMKLVYMSLSENQITFSIKSNTEGNVTKTIDAKYSGDDYEIGFNLDFLLAVASHLDSEEMELSIINKKEPIIITSNNDSSGDSNGDSTLYLLMPMRI